MLERAIGTSRQTLPAINAHAHRGNPIGMVRTAMHEASRIRGAFFGRGQGSPHLVEAGSLTGYFSQGLASRSPIPFFQVHLSEQVARQPFSGTRRAHLWQ